MKNSKFKKLNKLVKSNGVYLGAYILLSRSLDAIRSKIFSWIADAPNIHLGQGSQISGIKFIRFGKNITIYRGLWMQAVTSYSGQDFEPTITVGDNVAFSNGVHITAINKISIGNNVMFGSNVFISDHNHGGYSDEHHTPPSVSPSNRFLVSKGEVIIQDNVWFGDNVNVVGPVHIGFGAIIAANSVVRTNIPDGCIAAGSPAKIIKIYNKTSKKWVRYE